MPDDAALTPPSSPAFPGGRLPAGAGAGAGTGAGTGESAGHGQPAGWRAHLQLGYARRNAQTVLVERRHQGPLRVQKALYPEGPGICHSLLLHPPSGIVGGDLLDVDVHVQPAAHALLTNPGATKWYRSAGATALQDLRFRVDDGARLEWLPQENIVFDGALARSSLQVNLGEGAQFLGLEVLCLGRRAAGERFAHGRFGLSTRISAQGCPLWHEWGTLHGGSAFLEHAAGLRGAATSATLLLAGVDDAPALVKLLRAAVPASVQWACTALPGVLVARWLGVADAGGAGSGPEAARAWFLQCWQVLRPLALGVPVNVPRIWRT